MVDNLFLVVFLMAISGGPHCLGMCGGIHFSQQNKIGMRVWLLHAGRVTTYTILGGVFGALGASAVALRTDTMQLTMILYVIANILVIIYGLSFMGILNWFVRSTQIGLTAWFESKVGPMIAYVTTRIDANYGQYVKGILWGLIPCGLTYNALILAPATQNVYLGAGLMLLFGLGTVPAFTVAGGVFRWIRQKPMARRFIGVFVLVMGVWGLVHALSHGQHSHAQMAEHDHAAMPQHETSDAASEMQNSASMHHHVNQRDASVNSSARHQHDH